jgi:Rrf2 family protein
LLEAYMQITKATGYALMGLVYLARRKDSDPVFIREICKAHKIPQSYLMKIFKRTNLVRSHRGVTGGFALSRPADQITLREILEEVEGPLTLVACLSNPRACDQIPYCNMLPVWESVQEKLEEILDGYTLADLAQLPEAATAGKGRSGGKSGRRR